MNSSNSAGQNGLSDLAYDLVTIMHNKAKAIRAYETYIGDAQKANSQECAQLMQRIHEDDLRHLEELKLHVAAVLTGGPMPGQGQGSSQSQGSSQNRQTG